MRIHTYTAAETRLLVNSYLLETERGVVAVDTNLLNSDIAALKARLAALKKPLLAVFVTHAHLDHFNGVLDLVREREVPVYATVGVDRAIRDIADAKRAQWAPVYGSEWPSETFYPSIVLADRQVVDVDGLSYCARMNLEIEHLSPAGMRVNPAFTNAIVVSGPAKRIIIGAVDPVNEAGELVGPNDIVAQTEQVFHNLEILLAAAGATLTDVVIWRIFVVQGQSLQAGASVFFKRWGQRPNPPANTIVFVPALGVLGALLTLEAEAIVAV